MSVLEKLASLNLTLPTPPESVGFYVPVIKTGNLIVTSGQLPFVGKELMFTGMLGDELHEQDGQDAARLCTLNALAQIGTLVDSLDGIKQIVRIEGFIQSANGFTNQAQVLNGASELLVELFDERGKHTRAAIGASELPLNASVELSMWVEV